MQELSRKMQEILFTTPLFAKGKKISWELGIMLKFNVNNIFQKGEN